MKLPLDLTGFETTFFEITTRFSLFKKIHIKSTNIPNIKCHTILDCAQCQLQDRLHTQVSNLCLSHWKRQNVKVVSKPAKSMSKPVKSTFKLPLF